MTAFLRTLTPPPPPPIHLLLAVVLQVLVMIATASPNTWGLPSAVPAKSVHRAVGWRPPIAEATQSDILRPFVPPAMPWSSAHRGVDIRAPSERVIAPAAGEVTFVGTVVDRSVLTIRHANGMLSSFEPVESELAVGDRVAAGQLLGTLDLTSAHCEIPCVHWGVRKPDAWHIGSSVRDLYLDPAFLLGWTEPSILWPIRSDPVF